MIFGFFVLLVAVAISTIAAYYSIVGLTAIFAAAMTPIVVMGTALEIGKVASAVWLHLHWKRASFLMKTYLVSAVALLMFITSMGIFGFLSKAHVEQTAQSVESVQQAERYTVEIARQEAVIARAEAKVQDLETSGAGADTSIQMQIDLESERVETAYSRIQPAIDQQLAIIASESERLSTRLRPYQNQVDSIDEKLQLISLYIGTSEIRKLQGLVGTAVDGSYGSDTAGKVEVFRLNEENKKNELLVKIDNLNSEVSPIATAARAEITRLRNTADREVSAMNTTISQLRSQLGKTSSEDLGALIDEQNDKIRAATLLIDDMTSEKYAIEAEYRKLEAEVGPVKFIAELVYGDVTSNVLEDAVRIVILILVVVFDPLAITLVLAGIMSIEWAREEKAVVKPIKSAVQYREEDEEDEDVYEEEFVDDDELDIDEEIDEKAEEILLHGKEPTAITKTNKPGGWLDQ
jgi:hypothetical protein